MHTEEGKAAKLLQLLLWLQRRRPLRRRLDAVLRVPAAAVVAVDDLLAKLGRCVVCFGVGGTSVSSFSIHFEAAATAAARLGCRCGRGGVEGSLSREGTVQRDEFIF